MGKADDKPTAKSLLDLPDSAEPPLTPEQSLEMLRGLFGPLSGMPAVRLDLSPLVQAFDERTQFSAGGVIDLACAPADKPEKPAGGRRQWQQQAVRDVLPKLTDRDGKVLYPDGKVPDSVTTETVRQEAIVELGHDVGWNTVHRALGRGE